MKFLSISAVAIMTFSTVVGGPQEQPAGEGRLEPTRTSCAEYIEVVEAEDGRADVANVWAHGYHSAHTGVDHTSETAITWKRVNEFVARLDRVCREKPDTLFLTAIRKVK